MTEDLLKVIAGLECCQAENLDCSVCPYDDGKMGVDCMERMNADALRILREVEQDGLY